MSFFFLQMKGREEEKGEYAPSLPSLLPAPESQTQHEEMLQCIPEFQLRMREMACGQVRLSPEQHRLYFAWISFAYPHLAGE